MHIPVRWQFLQLIQVRPLPDRERQRSAANHVSTWLVASGHVPRNQRKVSKKIRFGVESMVRSLKQTTGVGLYRYCLTPATNITVWASRRERGRKTLLTLENCGELDSRMRSGFSRSIGKTDNTQIVCPRASAIRTGKFQKSEWGGYDRVMRQKKMPPNNEKATFRWLISMASHWPPQSVPSEQVCGIDQAPVAAGPGRTWLCLPDLRRWTRDFSASIVRPWLHYSVQLGCRFGCALLSASCGMGGVKEFRFMEGWNRKYFWIS